MGATKAIVARLTLMNNRSGLHFFQIRYGFFASGSIAEPSYPDKIRFVRHKAFNDAADAGEFAAEFFVGDHCALIHIELLTNQYHLRAKTKLGVWSSSAEREPRPATIPTTKGLVACLFKERLMMMGKSHISG
jgi:hypothetical protein